MAYDLMTYSFINALSRFLSRRGPVKDIYLDNGTNFIGSAKIIMDCITQWNQAQIHKFLQQKNSIWFFSDPNASHMSGV